MKREFHQGLLLGVVFILLGVFGFFENFLGITFKSSFIELDLDTKLVTHALWGMLCSYIAYKKNRNPVSAYFVGQVIAFFGVLYYLLVRSGLSPKEKAIHDWEVQKRYEQMEAERTKSTSNT